MREIGKKIRCPTLWGDVGTGKTFLAGCIANALMEKNIPVLMTSFPKLLNALGGIYSGEKNEYLKSLNRYQLLIIDDLGVERDTPYVLETVYLVIDERYKSGKPFIITTNLSLENFRIRQIWNMDVSMTALWKGVFRLPFQEKTIGRVKAERTWKVFQGF